MQLTLKRGQSKATLSLVPLRIGGGVKFTLNAQAGMSQEETHLLRRYQFEDALLIADDPIVAVKKAARTATVLSIPLSFVLLFIFGTLSGSVLSFLGFLVLTCFYYQHLREHIYVRDLIQGRRFQCFSVVELIQKEAYLEYMASYLRQILESAKNWDDKETIEIPPLDREEAKRAVRTGKLGV